MSLTSPRLLSAHGAAVTNLGGTCCPNCGSRNNSVIDSRPSYQSTRRRRNCDQCGARWTTFEVTGEEIGRAFYPQVDQMNRNEVRPRMSKEEAEARALEIGEAIRADQFAHYNHCLTTNAGNSGYCDAIRKDLAKLEAAAPAVRWHKGA